jgi:hypothetical protein
MSDEFKRLINEILEKESLAYRIIGKKIAPITSEVEIKEIESALENSNKSPLKPINLHLQSALEKFSDKTNPDYRNSINESINAV